MIDEQNKKISEEIENLVKRGITIINDEAKKLESNENSEVETNPLEFRYERWYTKASRLVEQLLPARIDDFRQLYKLASRKEIDYLTYTISDYLLQVRVKYGGREIINGKVALEVFAMKFRNQISIVNSTREILDSSLANIRGVLQADLFDSELDAAEELLKSGQARSAGVLAGVTLEGHLETICQNHKVKITKKYPTISTYNDTLKDKTIYDVAQWRFIQHLADLRNKCAHKGTNEPTKQDAQDLIDGVKKVIKTVF